MLFDVLLEKLKQTKFRVDKTNRSRKGKINPKNAQIIHFAHHNQTYPNKTSVFQSTNAIHIYPDLYDTLKEIARTHFPQFEYNWIQVSKNVKTDKHYDKGNVGMSWTFTLGDFTGGLLMTEDGGIDTHNKPTEFDGKNTLHWTGDWTGGDRYFVIYFYNKKANPPEKLKGAIDKLNPTNRTDYLTISEIFRYDIYKTDKLVSSGEVWIDLGANIGAFTLKCLQLGVKRVYAYEPNQRNFSKLVTAFCGDDRVVLNKCAVSDYEGQAPLYLDKTGEWRHTIHRKILRRETEMVDVIDAINLPDCDGIKMDIEGSEVAVVKRLTQFPKKLMLEYDGGHHKLKKDYDEFIDFLKSKYHNVDCIELKKDIDFFPNGLNIRCYDKI
jgi:FkbM family methyltransferase